MADRRQVLELFEAHKDFVDKKVSEGIEKNRKGDAKITVTDKNGKPIEGAKITASQKSHETATPTIHRPHFKRCL